LREQKKLTLVVGVVVILFVSPISFDISFSTRKEIIRATRLISEPSDPL
jgi:hypothetical protein